MFDLIKYAEENRCSVTMTPVFEEYDKDGKRLYAWKVIIESESGKCDGIVDCITPEYLDTMLARIGSQYAERYGNIEQSRRRAEMERFWKEGRAIFVSEDQM